MNRKWQRRPYELNALRVVRHTRQLALYWARRCRKSTTLGAIALDELSVESGRTVIAASASLLLGRELVGMTLSAVEQSLIVAEEASALRDVLTQGVAERGLDLQVADAGKDKVLAGLSSADFAELYRSSRMELRIVFDPTRFSRLQIIAPHPATARSWRATVLRDEGFTPAAFENELRAATDPMMRDRPTLKMIYASNLCANDRHPYFETTLPREITPASEDEQFPADPLGHLYYGQQGILVHRVALKDAYAAGHQLYDDHGQPLSYEQCRAGPLFKLGWDASYALNHKCGGAAVIDLVALTNAQRRGVNECAFFFVDQDGDFERAVATLRALLRAGTVGIGFDVASTTGETANPSSVTVTEQIGVERFQRLVVLWKEKKPQVARERLKRLIEVIRQRPQGGGARRLCIDAGNERLFAEQTADELRHLVSVQLVMAGAAVDPPPPGYHETINYKTYLGDLYAAAVNDGRCALPADDYFKTDHRLVMKDAGRYQCTPEPDGKHGDTFDSGKLAEYALQAPAAPGKFYAFNSPRARFAHRERCLPG